MDCIIRAISHNSIFIRLLLWWRGLLSENKIPPTLRERLKNYVPELSENIPGLDAVNKSLENDIGYLNSKEEFIYILKSGRVNDNKNGRLTSFKNDSHAQMRKYYSVKVMGYKDILELDFIRDRVFFLHIDMEDYTDVFSVFEQYILSDDKECIYKIKLSTLRSVF